MTRLYSKPPFASSRLRWVILALIFGAMALNYVDRQIVGVLKPVLKTEFATDDVGYAQLVNVFTLCYAASYPVAGYLVDRLGAGRMMLLGLVSWSAACLLGGATRTFGQLAATRAALGLAEPMGFPAQLRTVTIWFPTTLRATANSICAAGSTVGAVVAAPLVAYLATQFHWRAAFVVPGVAGLALGGLWWFLYRDPPAVHVPSASAATDALPTEPRLSWPALWRTRALWGILLSRFISDPVWYFCLFWLPGYLQESSGLTLAQIGMVGWIPFLAADVGGVLSSVGSDRLVRAGIAPLRARKLTLAFAAAIAPVCALTPHLPGAAATLAIFSIVGAVCLTWLFNLGVVVAETFPSANVGSVWGIAGACGAAGAIFFNAFVGHMLGTLGAERIFGLMAILHPLAAVVLWTVVKPATPGRQPTRGAAP